MGAAEEHAESVQNAALVEELPSSVDVEDQNVGYEHVAVKYGPATALFNKFIWHGGSVYDAWLNAVSAQVGQVILTMPTSYSQMGFGLGIFIHLLYASLGTWTCYLLASLYVEYRARREKGGDVFRRHVIQYHEVMGYLIGPWGKRAALFFNICSMGSISIVQIIACASDVYYLNPHLNKRQWALIFGAMGLFTVFIPTIHNFRIWAVIGVMTTTYTAWYMTIASLRAGQAPGVKHSAPQNLHLFFTGSSNIIFAFGGHAVTVEIMHAMWKPRKYKYVYLFTVLYVLTITMPHSISVYWAFGDNLIKHSNAFSVLPSSNFRSAGIVMMIFHQAVAFGIYIMPLFFMWEKLLGIHQSYFPLRVVARVPIVLVIWLIALAFPFFGPFNSLIGAAILSFSTYIIPCVAYLITFWSPTARQNAAEKHPKWWPSWSVQVAFNIFVIGLLLIFGTGFGSWASIYNIVNQVKTFGLFEKCYQC